MFGKLKEKLKGWFSSSKEKVEETAEKKEVKVKEKPEKVKKEEKIKEKPEKKKPEKVKKEEPKEESKEELKEKIKEEEKKITEIKEEIKEFKETGELVKEEKLAPGWTKENLDEFESLLDNLDNDVIERITKRLEMSLSKPVSKLLKKDIVKEISKEHTFEKIKDAMAEELKEPEVEPETEAEEGAEEEIKETKPWVGEEGEVEEKPEEEIEEEKPKKGFFQKIRSTFSYKISEEEFNNIFDDLEMLLLENNVALEVVEDIKESLGKELIGKEVSKDNLESKIQEGLKKALNEVIIEPDNPLDFIKEAEKPYVILFFGINGTGKTTTIAKIANYLKKSGLSVVLAAADTFRAASIEQISLHAEKLGVPIIKHDYGSDPAAVGFDAIKYAKSHNIDVVLIDTAGRMHTKSNLIAEMEKISRVCKPNLKVFVAESIAGNDATEQAKTFNEAINIDGSVLSKVDVDEKGGTIISVSHVTKKPIFYLGVGQDYDDLELFNKQKFIENLLG